MIYQLLFSVKNFLSLLEFNFIVNDLTYFRECFSIFNSSVSIWFLNTCSCRYSFLTSLEYRVMGSNYPLNNFFYVDPESDPRAVSKTKFPEYLLICIHAYGIVPTSLSENNWEIIFLRKNGNDLNEVLNNISRSIFHFPFHCTHQYKLFIFSYKNGIH